MRKRRWPEALLTSVGVAAGITSVAVTPPQLAGFLWIAMCVALGISCVLSQLSQTIDLISGQFDEAGAVDHGASQITIVPNPLPIHASPLARSGS